MKITQQYCFINTTQNITLKIKIVKYKQCEKLKNLLNVRFIEYRFDYSKS